MKIAILTSGVLPVPAVQGGAVENLIDAALAYNDMHGQHDITVVSCYHPDVQHHPALQSHHNHYVYIDRKSLWNRLRAKLFGKLNAKDSYYHYQLEFFLEESYNRLRNKKFDLIILENRPGFAIKLRQHTTTPIVSHIHTDLVNPEKPQANAIVGSTDAFLCVSDYIKSHILSVGIPTKVSVVYNGLDTSIFLSSRHDPSINRRAMGFEDSDFIVIYTGRLVPKKGVKEAIQALQLLDNHPDIKMLVVGGDNYADSVSSNPYLDELHAMGQAMPGRVRFTGFVSYGLLPSYLSLANVAVVPSRINEALGMSPIEAIAMGLPVIATNDGGIPETLEGQHHVLIDANGDLPRQIANAILHIQTHYADYLGNQLPQRFTKEAYAASFFKAIEQYGI